MSDTLWLVIAAALTWTAYLFGRWRGVVAASRVVEERVKHFQRRSR